MNQISNKCFVSIMSPREKIIAMNLLKNYDLHLLSILINELHSGNLISRVLNGWPEENSVSVVLSQPFLKKHTASNIRYFKLDPHEGKELYQSEKSNDTLLN